MPKLNLWKSRDNGLTLDSIESAISYLNEKRKALYFNFNFAICDNDGISKQKGWEHYKQEFNIKKHRLNAVQFVVYGNVTLGKFLLSRLGIL